MQNIEADEFVPAVMGSGEQYLVLFYADWCPFCAKFRPIFEAYDGKLPYKVVGTKLNEDSNPLWDIFQIDSIPTMIAFDRGEVVTRKDAKHGVGLTKEDMDSIIREIS